MVNMRALIDNRPYFDRIMHFYRMFSYDKAYNWDNILIEPRKITRISTSSISSLLQALLRYGQEGEKNFLIATHGNPHGLPIRVRAGNPATLNSDLMDALSRALSDTQSSRQDGRDYAMSYQANGHNVFNNQQQLDDLLGVIRRVRQLQLERVEFRGCNIGAGPALRSLHRLLGIRITAAPTVQFMWSRLPTGSFHNISADQFSQQLGNLPASRKTYTNVDCYRASSQGDEVVVALAMAGNTIRLIARNRDMIKGFTQSYLQRPTLFAMGQEPAGGGYRPGGYLPIIGFLTPNAAYPFVLPGELDYTDYLNYEIEPPRHLPFP